MAMTKGDIDGIMALMREGLTITAVKLLRTYSAMGLAEAKQYLEKPRLRERLEADFVHSTEELLARAETALRRQQIYVDELRAQLVEELTAKTAIQVDRIHLSDTGFAPRVPD